MSSNQAERELEVARLLRRLVELEAAPIMILELLPTVQKKDVDKIWLKIHKTAPKKGRHPSDYEWFVETRQLRAEATCFLQSYLLLKNSKSRAQRLVSAYERYLAVFKEPLIPFKRAWLLPQGHQSLDIEIRQCDECGAHYIDKTDILPAKSRCPYVKLHTRPVSGVA